MKKKMIPKSAVQSLIKAIDRYIAKADQNFRDEIESEGFLAADAAMEAEEALENGMTDAINDHVDGVLDTLGDASSLKRYVEKTWPEIQKETELRDKLHDLFYVQFTQLLHTGVVAYLKDSDEEVGTAAEEDGRVTPYATEFINGWSGQLSEIMHLSTDRQINKILVDSAEKNLSISETALAIGKSGIRSPGARSRVVAQTEVLRIESYSHLEAMRQDPAATEKEWIHTGTHKNKPRENHVAISGQTVPIDQPFSLSGYSPMCPRDTNLPAGESINCHCIMRQKKDSAVLGLSADERKALREKYLNQAEEEWNVRHSGLNENPLSGIIASSTGSVIPNAATRASIISKAVSAPKPVYEQRLRDIYPKVKPKEGCYDFVIHGSRFFVEYEKKYQLDVGTVVEIITRRRDYEGGNIRLLSCSTGSKDVNGDCFAQRLANMLGVNVYAPIDILTINPDGTMVVGKNEMPEELGFTWFEPRY